MAYDANTPNNLAKILPGIHPYFGVRVEARLLLFYPKPDMLLEGKVVKLAQQSIHVVVLGFSSATIIEEDIRKEFHFKVKHGEEVFVSTANKSHKIKVGSIVRFIVKSFDEEILHVSGSLLPAHTGSVRWLNKNTEDLPQADSNTKKRRVSEGDPEMLEHDKVMANEEMLSLKVDHRKKKSKKK